MSADQDPATAAFEQLRSEVALLRRGVEGLAAKADDKPVNYNATLGKLAKSVAEIGEKVDQLAEQPMMVLPPEALTNLLRATAANMLAAPIAEFSRGHTAMTQAVTSLGRSAEALKAHGQSVELGTLLRWATVTVVLTLAAWIGLSGPIARALPADWHVAEHMAAAALDQPPWEAGARLMRSSSPTAWRQLQSREALWRKNETVLNACLRRSDSQKRWVRCNIRVGG